MSSRFRSGLEGGQKSVGQKSVKFVLQYCYTLFTVQHLAGSWVHTYLLLMVAGFQPAKRNGTTGPFCTPQPPLSSQAQNIGGHLVPSGVMTPRTIIWPAVLCAETIFFLRRLLNKHVPALRTSSHRDDAVPSAIRLFNTVK